MITSLSMSISYDLEQSNTPCLKELDPYDYLGTTLTKQADDT